VQTEKAIPTPSRPPPPALLVPNESSVPSNVTRGHTLTAIALGLFFASVYLANGRGVAGGDIDPATFMPIALVHGDGPFLDRFPFVFGRRGEATHAATWSRGHVVSRYPIAPAVIAVPFTALQMAYLDAVRPGWERQHVHFFAVFMAKTSHALLTAALGALLYILCLQLGVGGSFALLAAVAGALGSSLWSIASQGAWQHGPAALGLTATLCLLKMEKTSSLRLVAAGLAAAFMVASRSFTLMFALAFAGWVVSTYRWRALPFFLFPVLLGGATLLYNLMYFGTLSGGQAQLEALHPLYHGVQGTWTGSLWKGALGTLFSPNRGFFIFTPWALWALALLPLVGVRSLPSLLKWQLAALIVCALMLSKYSCWWAGWSFGPRFWTDTLPLWTALLGITGQAAWQKARWLLVPAVSFVLVAMGMHGMGAYGYPSSWNGHPKNVDLAHSRLWDWEDTELSRIRKEGKLPSVLWDWPPP
jgi:hypothetical protein